MTDRMKILTFCTVLAAGAVLTAAPQKDQKSAPAMPQMPPQTVEVENAILKLDAPVKKYVGHLAATSTIQLRARVSGNLNSTLFSEGDLVKKGQLLYEIEDVTYRAKAQAAAAQVRQIEAELIYAKSDYERKKNLLDKKAVSEVVFDEATRLLKSTEAKLTEAKANLMDAENSLSYTKIYAPIDGRIGKSTYSTGNYVTPSSDPLVTLVRITPIYARFAISERDFLQLFKSLDDMRKHAIVTLTTADGKQYPFQGKIRMTDCQVDPETGTIRTWSIFENPENRLIPGGYATVGLSRNDSPKKTAVKLSALMTDQKGSYVYVLTPDNKVVRRDIIAGHVISPWQLIDSGLKPGEKVITDGTHKVRPGGTAIPVQATK